jgi:hypothetical protein
MNQGRISELIPGALATEVCPNLWFTPPAPAEIHRYLGYPPDATPAGRIEQRISRIVKEALPCLRPRGAYSLYAVSRRTARSLKLDETTISGDIGEFLGQAGRVAVFVVTVGEEISGLAEFAAKYGDAFAALVLDATGSWAAEIAADALMMHIRCHLQDQEELTLRYSPGYCGMEISQQHKLFQIVQADSVGVRLLPSLLMHPLKSISGIVGLAPKEIIGSYHSPCDLCPQAGCHMRR